MRAIWLWVALFNFLVAACMGATMRFAFLYEIPGLSFKAFLHGHSHGAMLGWVYLALYSLFIGAFLPEDRQKKPLYSRLFWATEVLVLGMFLSFPVQGYGPISILFSTLHLLLSYVFAFRFWRDSREGRTHSFALARLALCWMCLSTAGVWAMGPIMQSALRGSEWYYLAVQFFLHFQFNGWFLFGALALFFRWLEAQGIELQGRLQGRFTWALGVSTILTFALAVAWSNPLPGVFVTNSIGVMVQLLALWWLRALVLPVLPRIREKVGSWNYRLWQVTLFSFIAKVFIQATVVVPEVARMAYTIRHFVIGFIHLIMLGALSLFFLAYMDCETKLFGRLQRYRAGLGLFVAGFVLSEGLLFGQGLLFWARMGFLPYYYWLLFGASALMPAGLLLIFSAVRGGIFKASPANR